MAAEWFVLLLHNSPGQTFEDFACFACCKSLGFLSQSKITCSGWLESVNMPLYVVTCTAILEILGKTIDGWKVIDLSSHVGQNGFVGKQRNTILTVSYLLSDLQKISRSDASRFTDVVEQWLTSWWMNRRSPPDTDPDSLLVRRFPRQVLLQHVDRREQRVKPANLEKACLLLTPYFYRCSPAFQHTGSGLFFFSHSTHNHKESSAKLFIRTNVYTWTPSEPHNHWG